MKCFLSKISHLGKISKNSTKNLDESFINCQLYPFSFNLMRKYNSTKMTIKYLVTFSKYFKPLMILFYSCLIKSLDFEGDFQDVNDILEWKEFEPGPTNHPFLCLKDSNFEWPRMTDPMILDVYKQPFLPPGPYDTEIFGVQEVDRHGRFYEYLDHTNLVNQQNQIWQIVTNYFEYETNGRYVVEEQSSEDNSQYNSEYETTAPFNPETETFFPIMTQNLGQNEVRAVLERNEQENTFQRNFNGLNGVSGVNPRNILNQHTISDNQSVNSFQNDRVSFREYIVLYFGSFINSNTIDANRTTNGQNVPREYEQNGNTINAVNSTQFHSADFYTQQHFEGADPDEPQYRNRPHSAITAPRKENTESNRENPQMGDLPERRQRGLNCQNVCEENSKDQLSELPSQESERSSSKNGSEPEKYERKPGKYESEKYESKPEKKDERKSLFTSIAFLSFLVTIVFFCIPPLYKKIYGVSLFSRE
ncbi:hypothetical protein M153_2200022709 [Pseudoloma neurophilia]|uniref:Uncharacterized protein n=1 Tax=Pseudoloma neurophilia TaxID=146866 RepID=A0A0R0M0V8_9MICR|nr:hypothetical protein M153_2200022709 [Pseudoloma neurophilia]